MPSLRKLSIIVPVYNETNTIVEILERIERFCTPLAMAKEIIIIDDGSNDGTTQKLQPFHHRPSFKILTQKENRGKASAVLCGLAQSTGDIILFQDADLEYSPKDYPALLQPILEEKADVVYGSRFKGNIANMTWVNRLANTISNVTINILYGVKLSDVNTCFKVFRREVFKDIRITSQNFTLETELTSKILKQGLFICEVPIDYVARNKSQGKKMNWLKAIEMYGGLFRYRFG